MRKASIVLAVTACAASSMALAQQGNPSPLQAAEVAHAASDDTGRAPGKSGFGQIMSVLTGLLQDAAGKESAGVSSSGARTLSAEDSAVTITVTPVAGRSTFFVDKSFVDNPPVRRQGRDRPGTSNTPPAQSTGTAIDAQSVALQSKGGAPN